MHNIHLLNFSLLICIIQANIGIANLLALAMEAEGSTIEEARSKIWMVDSRGLIVKVTLRAGSISFFL